MIRLLLIISALLISHIAYSQNKFLKSGSIGTVGKAEVKNKKLYGPVDFRELEEMIGEEFILMPKNKSSQSFGYQTIYKESAKSLTDHLSYEEGRGLILKLISFDGLRAVFQDSIGNKYKSTAYGKTFKDMASIRDLNEADKLFSGRTLWVQDFGLSTYDEKTDSFGFVPEMRLKQVTVESIVVGLHDFQPVRFILKTTAGLIGFLDVNMSGSNLNYQSRNLYSFDREFWTFNPKVKYKYPPDIWKLIVKREVKIGMTAQQVKLSLNEPKDIKFSEYQSGSHEQWIYGNDADRTYYYFENGRLIGQN